jgi:hypothetical protein
MRCCLDHIHLTSDLLVQHGLAAEHLHNQELHTLPSLIAQTVLGVLHYPAVILDSPAVATSTAAAE